MINKYDDNIMYRWVRDKVLKILEDSKYNGMSSYVSSKITYNQNYSTDNAAIEFSISGAIKTVIDIEVNQVLNDILKEKWISNSATCQNYILIIPIEIEQEVFSICAKYIMNYEIWTYYFEEKEKETDVIINFY